MKIKYNYKTKVFSISEDNLIADEVQSKSFSNLQDVRENVLNKGGYNALEKFDKEYRKQRLKNGLKTVGAILLALTSLGALGLSIKNSIDTSKLDKLSKVNIARDKTQDKNIEKLSTDLDREVGVRSQVDDMLWNRDEELGQLLEQEANNRYKDDSYLQDLILGR